MRNGSTLCPQRTGVVLVPRDRRLTVAQPLWRLAAQVPHRVTRNVDVAQQLLRQTNECGVRPHVLHAFGEHAVLLLAWVWIK